jgi:GNAT superfamily N-acetyltransferase
MITKIDLNAEKHWFLDCWNKEFSENFPISNRVFTEKINVNDNIVASVGYGFLIDNCIFGLLVLKYYLKKQKSNFAYISLIYVLPTKRNQGIGQALLDFGIAFGKNNGYSKLYVGSDPLSLFSGVFIDHNESTHEFFLKRGFTKFYKNVNLICIQPPKEQLMNRNIRLITTDKEKQAVLSMVKKNFSIRWYQDIKKATPSEFVVAYDNEEVIGFVRISHLGFPTMANSLNLHLKYANLGGIGPLGIIPSYQKKGLGKQIVQFALQVLFQLGCKEVLVDWTGLIEFYQKCGFLTISEQYIIYQQELLLGGINK